MGWITIYITGKDDFREDVREKLDSAALRVMPGYLGGSPVEAFADMYWVDEKTRLRELKEVIGSKLIWKYRLRFYGSLEAFIESQNPKSKATEFTPEENALLAEMQASVYKVA